MKLIIISFIYLLIGLSFAGDTPSNCGLHLTNTIELRGNKQLDELKEVNIASFNFENMNYKTKRQPLKKNPRDLKKIANIVYHEKVDFLIVQEIENQAVLDAYNKEYLQDRFKAIVISGNDSNRKIGFLIDRDFPFKINIETQAHQKIFNNVQNREIDLFSRDLPALHIRYKNKSATDPPDFIMLGTHYKSQRDFKGDPRSVRRRTDQVEATAKIIRSYEEKYPQTTIFLAGDFNANIHKDPEFESLFKDNLMIDSFDLNNQNMSDLERVTQTFHPRGGETKKSQLDAIMTNKNGKDKVLSSKIYRYKDENGNSKRLPETYQERSKNPSDHFMVIMKTNLKGLLE